MGSEYTQEKQLIQKLKKEFDLGKPQDVLALYAKFQSGEYHFRTKEGLAFDDEVYELAMQAKEKAKEKQKSESSRNNLNTKKDRKLAKKVVVYTKKEYFVRKMIICFLALVMVGCFSYFGLYYYNAYQKNLQTESLNRLKESSEINDMYQDTSHEFVNEETGEKKVLKVLDEYKSLFNKNKNLIGWLKIDDTIIDYPVMQTENNEFYLDHDINQEPDKNGTLFMDTACDVTKPSTNYIIYGHNMRSGKMFGSLSKYKSKDYFEKHMYIQFDTIYEKATYQVLYVFQSKIYNEDEVVFKYYQFIDANSKEEFDSYMNEMAELSLYDTGITAEFGDNLLTLSTCDYEEKDGRFVVVAKRIE